VTAAFAGPAALLGGTLLLQQSGVVERADGAQAAGRPTAPLRLADTVTELKPAVAFTTVGIEEALMISNRRVN